jgi:hypothetical protein
MLLKGVMIINNNKYRYIQRMARVLSVIITAFWFIFSLLSGASEYGGGIKGIVQNSPNALPWVFLSIIIYIAWKRELIGGIIIVTISLFISFFFDIWEAGNRLLFFIIPLPLIIVGLLFIIHWYYQKKSCG